MRKKLFSFDPDGVSQQKSNNPPRKPIGFNSSSTNITGENNDFFETTPSEVHPSRRTSTKKEPKKESPKKDFFDSALTTNSKKSVPKLNITNNDFNF